MTAHPRSSLSRFVPDPVMTDAEFDKLQTKLFTEKRGMLVWLDEISNEFVRKYLEDLAKTKIRSGGK